MVSSGTLEFVSVADKRHTKMGSCNSSIRVRNFAGKLAEANPRPIWRLAEAFS